MDILQYNILDGCQDEERFSRFDEWIKTQSYDVIGFNEMNGWTTELLQKHAIKWGYKYSYLFETKSSAYRVGVISTTPILLIEATESLFHHGLLHVNIRGYHFFITHFSPHSNAYREKEASEIAKRVSKLSNEPVIVMGDLNTSSPSDMEHYRQSEEKEYSPMKLLLECGLEDTNISTSLNYTFPTSLLQDTINENKVRIDYILVNAKLKKINPISSVIRGSEIEKISDHYPVTCSWK